MTNWETWLVAFFSTFTTTSAFLLLNHLPKKGQWIEKTMTGLVFIGSLGIAAAPWCEVFNEPTVYELVFHVGVSIFACWLTAPYWREVPVLDRRHRSEGSHAERREAKCSP